MTIKIVKAWPLTKYVKFYMTPGQKYKAMWYGALDKEPILALSTVATTVASVMSIFFVFHEDNAGKRKYSKKITGLMIHDLIMYPVQARMIDKLWKIWKK